MQGAAPAKLTLADTYDTIVIRQVPVSTGDPVICRAWDVGSPEIRETSTPLAGQDGVDDGALFTGVRPVQLDLVVWGDDDAAAYEYAERLAAMTHPTRRPYLHIERSGITTTGPWRMPLRGNPYSLAYGRKAISMLEMTLAFTSPTGFFESPLNEVSSSGSLVTAIGWVFDADFPEGFGSGGNTATASITIAGSAPVSPRITIYGPSEDPAVVTDTGDIFAFDGLNLGDGEFVVIDMAAGTADVNGSDNNGAYHLVDWTRSRWFRLWPGARTVSVLGSVGQVVIAWRDRRLSI